MRVCAGHPDVHKDGNGPALGGRPRRVLAGRSLPGGLEAGHGSQQGRQPGPDQELVVDDEPARAPRSTRPGMCASVVLHPGGVPGGRALEEVGERSPDDAVRATGRSRRAGRTPFPWPGHPPADPAGRGRRAPRALARWARPHGLRRARQDQPPAHLDDGLAGAAPGVVQRLDDGPAGLRLLLQTELAGELAQPPGPGRRGRRASRRPRRAARCRGRRAGCPTGGRAAHRADTVRGPRAATGKRRTSGSWTAARARGRRCRASGPSGSGQSRSVVEEIHGEPTACTVSSTTGHRKRGPDADGRRGCGPPHVNPLEYNPGCTRPPPWGVGGLHPVEGRGRGRGARRFPGAGLIPASALPPGLRRAAVPVRGRARPRTRARGVACAQP